MSAKDVYNTIRLKNIKRAKLRQKQAELELAQKHKQPTEHIQKEIQTLKKQI
jgi:hypothetical protein